MGNGHISKASGEWDQRRTQKEKPRSDRKPLRWETNVVAVKRIEKESKEWKTRVFVQVEAIAYKVARNYPS